MILIAIVVAADTLSPFHFVAAYLLLMIISARVFWSLLSFHRFQLAFLPSSLLLEICTRSRIEFTSCKKLWIQIVCPSTQMSSSVALRVRASYVMDLFATVAKIAPQAAAVPSVCSRATSVSLLSKACAQYKASPTVQMETFTEIMPRSWTLCHQFLLSSQLMAQERSLLLMKRNRMHSGMESRLL